MITLQSSFEYVDDTAPPVDRADISIGYPKFLFEAPNSIIAGHGSYEFKQTLSDDHYTLHCLLQVYVYRPAAAACSTATTHGIPLAVRALPH